MKKAILIIITFVIISCSKNDLTRDTAESKITEYYNLPCAETVYFNNMTLGKNTIPPKYAELISGDYIYDDSQGSWNTYYYLTRKSMPFFDENKKAIVGNLIDFKEITGIKLNETKNRATVNFILKRKEITPFGKFADRFDGETFEKSIEFELYDDGWRVIESDLDKKFLPRESFGFYNKEFMKNFDEETQQIEIEAENRAE